MQSSHNILTNSAPTIAMVSAILFGASIPAAKLLLGHLHPQLLAGLLYVGSGFGLSIFAFIFRKPLFNQSSIQRSDLLYLTGAIACGGVIGPLLLMSGLQDAAAGTASLLLNTEGVFTALLAWFAFKENFDRRIVAGMISIVVGSIILAFQSASGLNISFGSLAIIAGCFCWALDNNLTRNITNVDPLHIAAIKGLIAGLTNCAIAFITGQSFPPIKVILEAATIGLLGYGISLILFIIALRKLGTARTGAYFSIAPFVGTILSILFLHEAMTTKLLVATVFMLIGVYLHLTEHHEHEHTHPEEEHEHLHVHDKHHQHAHAEGILVAEPHSHWHRHERVIHSHPHYPDSMHRHDH